MTWEHVITADAHDYTVFSTVSSGAHVVRSSSYARTGSNSFRLTGDRAAAASLIVASNATKYVAFSAAFDLVGVDNYFSNFNVQEGTTVHLQLRFQAWNSSILVYRGAGTTLLGTISNVFPRSVVFLDMKFVIHDTTGEVVIRDNNGSELLNFTGDTQNGGTGVIDTLQWGNDYFTGAAYADFYIDDIAVRTDDYCGAGGNYALPVTGAGANTAWTPSAGANYACVDEIPATFTDYVETDASVNATKDNYVATALPITADNIDVVAVYAKAQLDEAGSGEMRATIKSGASYGNGATTGLGTTAVWVKGFYETDPATSAAWVQANLNDAQPGIETVA